MAGQNLLKFMASPAIAAQLTFETSWANSVMETFLHLALLALSISALVRGYCTILYGTTAPIRLPNEPIQIKIVKLCVVIYCYAYRFVRWCPASCVHV